METLKFPAKQIRAEVIAAHVRAAGLQGVVCFSCGHASKALQDAGLYVVDVAPNGRLHAGTWWTQAEIARAWPHLFDATSGHLPPGVMVQLADAYRAHLGDLGPGPHHVDTGSGETVVALAMAYPDVEFVAVYGTAGPTKYEPKAPLNALVRRVARVVHLGR